MDQNYLLVPIGKTIDDVFANPEIVILCSASNENPQEGCEFIFKDVARLNELAEPPVGEE